MDQELQMLINTLYGDKLNEKQLSNIIQMWNNNQNGYLDLLRTQAASKMPAGTNKINPVIVLKVMNQVVGTTPKLGLSSYTFDKNAGKAVNDMSDITNFNDAFRKARQDGHKKFFWKKTKTNPSGMFSTETKPQGYDGSVKVNNNKVFLDIDKTDIPVFTGLTVDQFDIISPRIPVQGPVYEEQVDDPNFVPRIPILGITDLGIFNKQNPVEVSISGSDRIAGRKYAEGQNNANLYFGRKGMYKKGGNMNKVNYFEQGGTAQNSQADAFMQAVLQGDSDAIGQLIQAAKQGDKNADKLIQTILQEDLKGNQQVTKAATVIKQLLNQATSAKWGSKLQYIKSLKFAKGGKTCPACMKDGGNTVKVAKKDIDTKTYQKQSFAKKAELDEHRLGTETSANKNGSYNTSHKPSAQDSTTIHRSTMSADMNKKYPRVKSKACGGTAPKAKKHYFGGWL